MAALVAGERARMYALGGVARGGATRGGYHSPKLFVAINGVHYATARAVDGEQIDNDTFSLTNARPSRCSFQMRGVVIPDGAEVVVTMGTKHSGTRDFGGNVLNRTVSYVGTPANRHVQVNAIDFSWALNSRKVTKRYTSESGSAIGRDLIASFAPGYTSRHVEAGLPVLDEITFTDQTLTGALAQLAKRLGASQYIDFFRDLHLFTSEPLLTDPRPLVDGDTPLLESFSATFDASQFVTRVRVEGGGVNALGEVAVGETMLPVEDVAWYEATGGVVKCGPQRLTYAGTVEGGGGGLVGPGAAPSAAPAATLATGSGIEDGVHRYGVTFVTAAGESLAGPLATVTNGTSSVTTGAPATAPTVGTPAAGSGPDTGNHDYQVTYGTASGETTPSAISGAATTGPSTSGTLANPTTAPTPGTVIDGGNVDVGSHTYQVTFTNAAGETLAGPASGSATLSMVTRPGLTNNPTGTTGGSMTPGGVYYYGTTYYTASGETDILISGNVAVTLGGAENAVSITGIPTSGDSRVVGRKLYRSKMPNVGLESDHKLVATIANNSATTHTDTMADGSVGAGASAANTTGPGQVPLTNIPIGPSGTTGRKIHRNSQLLTTLANNTATTYTDNTSNAGLGAGPPGSNTTGSTVNLNQIPLTAIPIGPAVVTSRKLYRRFNGTGTFKLVTTIANNTATTYTDTTANASLGAAAPSTNTTTVVTVQNRVDLSAIPIGGASVTGRRIYRTVAGGAQLKLLYAYADNTTTAHTDFAADATLGANAPIADDSGLAQPEGQLNAGTTTMIVAGTGAFSSGGGWAVIGNGRQVIRYTGITASSLTGIPVSGPGAISATVGYNSTITAAPALIGIPASGTGSIVYAIKKGDPVNLVVQVDDAAAQAVVAALLSTATYTHDGVIEDDVVDGRLSSTEALARGQAQLALRNQIDVSARAVSRDMNTRVGRELAVNLADLGVNQTFTIQSVAVSDYTPARAPRYEGTLSSDLFSFEDLLRMARKDVTS